MYIGNSRYFQVIDDIKTQIIEAHMLISIPKEQGCQSV